jgi:UDPglucose--hexose-1-phosphate uridylyltransferase
VLVSPHRALRPWLGQVEKSASATQPEYDPQCYLCPGNARAGGARNPAYSGIFVFDNDFAALKSHVARQRLDVSGKGLLVAEGEAGICRVICFLPRHDLTLATMQVPDIERVVGTWTEQFRSLGEMPQIRHVQIFENRGAMMGASSPHPHCQIWATASIPEAVSKECHAQRDYLQERKSCLLCDYSAVELEQKVRLICANDDFLAVVPFWAVWPFEVLLCSRRHLGSLLEFTAKEVASLSSLLKQITSLYDRIFDVPFPYSMGFHQSPADDEPHREWHFHAHFYPPLLRSATVRKFMVGFEMLGTPQRDITPEMAAERMQSLAAL